MNKSIAVIPGDGIGPEVMVQAERVLQAVATNFAHKFELTQGVAGGAAFEQFGSHMPEETLALCRRSDAILFGSVGGPVSEQHLDKWKNCEANSILSLRKTFSFYANYRPVVLSPDLAEMCPLRPDIIKNGIDILFIRELLGDAYFGAKETTTEKGQRVARDTSQYTEDQIKQVVQRYRHGHAQRLALDSIRALSGQLETEPDWQSDTFLGHICTPRSFWRSPYRQYALHLQHIEEPLPRRADISNLAHSLPCE